jgi:hypothetical protein
VGSSAKVADFDALHLAEFENGKNNDGSTNVSTADYVDAEFKPEYRFSMNPPLMYLSNGFFRNHDVQARTARARAAHDKSNV